MALMQNIKAAICKNNGLILKLPLVQQFAKVGSTYNFGLYAGCEIYHGYKEVKLGGFANLPELRLKLYV